MTVGLYALCVIAVLLGGCSIYEKEDLAKMTATPGDACRDGEDPQKGKGDKGERSEDTQTDDEKKNADANGGGYDRGYDKAEGLQ